MSDSAFHPTRWTLIRRTRGRGDEARAALSELCAIYYDPVHAFVRQWTGREEGALDLTHAFFENLLARDTLTDAADPARGRFRSYLLGAVKHFLLKQRSREHTAKRGGGIEHVSLDAGGDPAAPATGENDPAFDRDWALALIRRSLTALEAEMTAAGKRRQFEVLQPWLDGGSAGSLATAGQELGLNPNALNVAIHRFRQRFLRLVRAEVEATTADPADAADEFRHLVNVLVTAG